MTILGVDPGTRATGYGVVEKSGSALRHVCHGVLRLDPAAPLCDRLVVLATGLRDVLATHAPVALSLEEVFQHRNAQSALKLGHARGVVMLLAAEAGLSVTGYTPAVVKQAVTGSGRAEKHQVQYMVRALLGLAETPPEDASDALAVAVCHALRATSPLEAMR
jgi:crossover junction endodeoxyribonuclease RuvC